MTDDPNKRRSEPSRVDFGAFLADVEARAAEADAERRALPCYPALQLEEPDEEAAVAACEAAEGWKGCRWATVPESCPRARVAADYDAAVRNLAAGAIAGRVPEREAAVILAAARPQARVPLVKFDTLQVVRALLARKRARVPLENGAEVLDRQGKRGAGAVHLTGLEVMAIMGGNQGRGKTLAACYAIARKGGMYTRAPQWTRLRAIDVDQAIAAPVLVIDQFGREHFGESEWALSQFEDVLDTRYQALSKLTLILGNLEWKTFAERLKKTTVIDRIFGEGGVFAEFGGESIRPALREKALKGDK